MTKPNKLTSVPSKDSDQPGHPPRLIKVFAVRMKKAWVLSCPLSALWRLWSDWADVQADLSLRWVHMLFCWFCHEVAHVIFRVSGYLMVLCFLLFFLQKFLYLMQTRLDPDQMSHVMRSWYFSSSETHSSNKHAQTSSGARCLIVGRTLCLPPYFMCANSEGSGETVWMRRLVSAFIGCLCDKYHKLMSWIKCHILWYQLVQWILENGGKSHASYRDPSTMKGMKSAVGCVILNVFFFFTALQDFFTHVESSQS